MTMRKERPEIGIRKLRRKLRGGNDPFKKGRTLKRGRNDPGLEEGTPLILLEGGTTMHIEVVVQTKAAMNEDGTAYCHDSAEHLSM